MKPRTFVMAATAALMVFALILLFPEVDPGWATLIAAFFGFGAIAWQMRESRAAEQERHQDEARRLATALAAELSILCRLQHEFVRNLSLTATPSARYAPTCIPKIYLANLDQLKILPGGVVWAMSNAMARLLDGQTEGEGEFSRTVHQAAELLVTMISAHLALIRFIQGEPEIGELSAKMLIEDREDGERLMMRAIELMDAYAPVREPAA